MTSALVRFVEALRRDGIAASPAEILDAAHALEVVGIAQRARVRAALRATLAKDRRKHERFDRIFDAFFRAPRAADDERGKKRSGSAAAGMGSSQESPARSTPPSRRAAPQPSPRGDAPRTGAKRPEPSTARREEPARRRRDGPRVSRAAPERPDGERGAAQTPTKRDLSAPASAAQERELARAAARLIEELRLRTGRRLRPARRGRLWSSRVLRASLAHGGVPFELPMRARRPRRPRVVLLVDVSFSVARAAGFFLWMASEFVRIGRDARVIAFVDRPVDATGAVRRWLRRAPPGSDPAVPERSGPRSRRMPGAGIAPAGRPFDGMLRSLRGLNLEAPSDYGRALHALLNSSLRPSGRATVLVVLGDGRTNRFDPLAWTLEELGRRCRAVLWLAPEPHARWGTADSALPAYLEAADVAVECHDLEGLARGLAELLRAL